MRLCCIPRVSKFFLFLDVAVCVKVSVELPLVQLVDLVLLRKKQIKPHQVSRLNTSSSKPASSSRTAPDKLSALSKYIRPALLRRGVNGATVYKSSDTSDGLVQLGRDKLGSTGAEVEERNAA